jgi:hypothetical protein
MTMLAGTSRLRISLGTSFSPGTWWLLFVLLRFQDVNAGRNYQCESAVAWRYTENEPR